MKDRYLHGPHAIERIRTIRDAFESAPWVKEARVGGLVDGRLVVGCTLHDYSRCRVLVEPDATSDDVAAMVAAGPR